MPKFTAPHSFRDGVVHVGVHSIQLDGHVGRSNALNAGEIAHLRGRGFTVDDDPAEATTPRKPRTSAPAVDANS